MRIAMVASECEPWAKTGGLADVVDALARALGARGHEVDVYLPLYRGLRPPADLEAHDLAVPMGVDPASGSEDGFERVRVVLRTGQADGYRLRLVDHEPSFDRDGFYGGASGDYPDNGARFTLLGRAALEAMRAEARPAGRAPLHDWQGGPAILSHPAAIRPRPAPGADADDAHVSQPRLHGWWCGSVPGHWTCPARRGYPEGVDLLREAIRAADMVTTVSPTYAPC